MYKPKKNSTSFFKTEMNPVPVLHSERAWVLVVSCGRCSVLWSIHVSLSHCFWLCWVFLNVSCLPMWGLCAVFVALQTKTVREQGWESEWRGSRDRGLPLPTQPKLYFSLKNSILPIWGREQWTSSITKGRHICAVLMLVRSIQPQIMSWSTTEITWSEQLPCITGCFFTV